MLFALIVGCSCVHFYVEQGVKKCFREDVASHNQLIVSFELMEVSEGDKRDKYECLLDVKAKSIDGPEVEHAKRKLTDVGKGKIAATMEASGLHFVCLICSATNRKWLKKTRRFKWKLSFDVMREEVHVTTPEDAEKDHKAVTKLEDHAMRLSNVLKHLDGVIAENIYQGGVEKEFEEQSLTANARVLHFSVAQILLLIACTCLQLYHLSSFIKETFAYRMLPLGGMVH